MDGIISNIPSSFTKAYEDAESELKNNLPPWQEATVSERLKLSYLNCLVSIPFLLLQFLMVSGYSIYVIYYVFPLIIYEEDRPELFYYHSYSEFEISRIRGWICLALMTLFFISFEVSHFQAIRTNPGTIPHTKEWEIPSDSDSESEGCEEMLLERRRDGSKRTCTTCHLKKPDRSHHCKMCERCILQMDHHCNWILNCVGFFNFKYFFLMIFYGALMLIVFSSTFWETVLVALNDDDYSVVCTYLLSIYYTFLLFLCLADIGFLSFHIWLMKNHYTTIEYCEKKRSKMALYEKSPFDKGAWNNFKSALGENPALWLFPCTYRTKEENGLFFHN